MQKKYLLINRANKIISKQIFIYITLGLFFAGYYIEMLLVPCHNYFNNNFDSQNLLVWKYATTIGLYPVRDLFYPYGELLYRRETSFFFILGYYLLFPSIFLAFYFILSKIFSRRIIQLAFLFAIFIIVEKFVDYESFIRYGLLTTSVAVISYIYFYYSNKKFTLSLIGVYIGILLVFITDQGLYVSVATLLVILFTELFERKTKNLQKIIFRCINAYLLVFTPALIMSLFYVGFLYHISALDEFLKHFTYIADISLYAKAPFFPSLRHPITYEVVFILMFSIGLLSHLIWKRKYLNNWRRTCIFSIAIVMLILEQKNIMRGIGVQTLLTAFLLLTVNLSVLIDFLNDKKISVIAMWFYIVVISIIFINSSGITAPQDRYVNYLRTNQLTSNIQNVFEVTEFSNKCIMDNAYGLVKDTNHKNVIDDLKNREDFNGKIFSYPADPVFYILLKQKIPYYLTGYEQSPLYAQKRIVTYLQQENIHYVIIKESKGVIDPSDIPIYIRNSYLLRHLLTHFQFDKQIGNFIIFKLAKSDYSFSKDDNFKNNAGEFYKILLDLDFGKIPSIEGYHKSTLLLDEKILMKKELKASSQIPLQLDSEKIIIGITTKSNQLFFLTLASQGLTSKVYMENCGKNFPCLLKVSNIPLFYKRSTIDSIMTSQDSEITIYESGMSIFNSFW